MRTLRGAPPPRGGHRKERTASKRRSGMAMASHALCLLAAGGGL
eukprot:CAMPEP_0174726388 /NCGR_PEP_ID=MMETSP1094-20130205/47725_1 /TAXON_ID=156173 /ORGANISM="Chrysochromulina brevifilum, Strain UTEX LB 985" /LENGTH=43 /DNA_ID= /DNA_START= /DNA_END= /DNA_ORIENTATION=